MNTVSKKSAHEANVRALLREQALAAPPPPNQQAQIEAALGVRHNPSPPPGGPMDPGEMI